jgi:hypothetical protein
VSLAPCGDCSGSAATARPGSEPLALSRSRNAAQQSMIAARCAEPFASQAMHALELCEV